MNLQSTDFDMQRRSKAKLRKIQVHEDMKYKEIMMIIVKKLLILQMMWSRSFTISTTLVGRVQLHIIILLMDGLCERLKHLVPKRAIEKVLLTSAKRVKVDFHLCKARKMVRRIRNMPKALWPSLLILLFVIIYFIVVIVVVVQVPVNFT